MTTQLPAEPLEPVPGQQPESDEAAPKPETRQVVIQLPQLVISRKVLSIAAAALVAVITGVIIVLTSGPGSIAVHGTEMVCGNLLDGTSPSDYTDITAGTQVVATDPSGKVIGTGSLIPAAAPASAQILGPTDEYTFTMTVPGGEARYGISIGHDRGTVWFSPAQMAKGPGVSLDC